MMSWVEVTSQAVPLCLAIWDNNKWTVLPALFVLSQTLLPFSTQQLSTKRVWHAFAKYMMCSFRRCELVQTWLPIALPKSVQNITLKTG